MARALSIAMVCALLASCTSAQAPKEIGETEVRQASDRFWTTRERGDVSSLLAQFTETAVFMVPGLPDAEGRVAIRDALQERFDSLRITDFEVHRREIRVIGDTAYELGWFSETSDPGEGDLRRMEGRYLLVWARENDDVWRVHRYFYNFSAATLIERSSR